MLSALSLRSYFLLLLLARPTRTFRRVLVVGIAPAILKRPASGLVEDRQIGPLHFPFLFSFACL